MAIQKQHVVGLGAPGGGGVVAVLVGGTIVGAGLGAYAGTLIRPDKKGLAAFVGAVVGAPLGYLASAFAAEYL